MHNPGMSSTESRALEISGPQPVWMTLNDARERAFTGEIVFELDPEVYAYLDHGVVYYAERAGEPELGRRLLEAGLLDEGQLERGVVRVGDVEHLGRLFDRDPSIDRDAVLVLTEVLTEDLITDLANREIATVRAVAYRHHPSGVHRWFVEPADPAAAALADMAQLGHTGRLSAIPAASDDVLSDELRIEWDEPLGVFDDGARSMFADFDVTRLDPVVETDFPTATSRDLDPSAHAVDDDQRVDVEFLPDADDATAADSEWSVTETETAATVEEVVDTDSDAGSDTDDSPPPDVEFQVVWPDGSATDVTETGVEAAPGVDEALALVHEDGGGFRFEMPPLTYGTSLDDSYGDDVDDDSVPDDVADAVRRALAAIETATVESASIAPMDDAIAVEYDDHDVADETSDDHRQDVGDQDEGTHDDAVSARAEEVDHLWGEQPADVPSADAPAPERAAAPLSPFAPPTPDMAAEAIYSREAAAATRPTPADAPSGVASVVFVVDDGDGDGDGERTSALKRLIGSLRRKDR